MNCLKLLILLGCLQLGCHAFVVPKTPGGQSMGWSFLNPNPFIKTNVLNRTTKSIRLFLASDAYSATNTLAELDSIRNAFAQWQAVPGSVIKFEEAGLVSPGVDVNTSDGTNVVFWAKNSETVNGGLDNLFGALGLTFTTFTDTYEIVEADMVFNGVRFQWVTDLNDPTTGKILVEATALHEFGHFLGLDHSVLGSATMLQRGSAGLSSLISLSTDETTYARSRYATNGLAAKLSVIRGSVTKAGSPVYGAAVVASDTRGNAIAGTVTIAGGIYELPGLPPGTYKVQCTPLDPFVQNRLISGVDISIDYDSTSAATTPDIQFLPSALVAATTTAGGIATVNFAVQAGSPVRLTGIRKAASSPDIFSFAIYPAVLQVGQSNQIIGVYSQGFTASSVLQISGDGLTVGPTVFNSGRGTLSVSVDVSPTAAPGMRSFVVTQNGSTVYANGFLDLQPLTYDDNYDGLPDAFQRKYFSLWTGTNAAPNADPDRDGFSNLQEYVAGTSPTDGNSRLRIESIKQTVSGAEVTWQSGAGSKYLVLSKAALPLTSWQTNATVVGNAGTTTYLDATATGASKFYRVIATP